jgi:light-harvesting complex I chlorophyll a/b binding protein 4
MMHTLPQRSLFAGVPVSGRAGGSIRKRASPVAAQAAERNLWAPSATAPDYLDGTLAGDYGWDPLALGAEKDRLGYYRQAELQNGRWAMLGVAGILGQEILKPGVFWYNAGLPENIPDLYFGPSKVNLGGLLAWEFLLFHWVELRRWQDIQNHHSVDQDPIFKNNKVPNEQQGYPGGIFDPFNFAKGNPKELQTKEIKNGRLAMVAFVGFVLQAQATGQGPLASLKSHISDPFNNNILKNIGQCHIPPSVNVEGITIPTPCLWPGQLV